MGTACSGRWAQCNPPVAPALLRVLPSVGPQSRRSGLGATFILVLIYLSKFTPRGSVSQTTARVSVIKALLPDMGSEVLLEGEETEEKKRIC